MCNIPQIWVLTYARPWSLSQGSWNRTICARHMDTGRKRRLEIKLNRDSGISGSGSLSQTPKSPIERCSYGHETQFGCQNEQSGFGDFGVWPQLSEQSKDLGNIIILFMQFYAPQTKILDGRTSVWERILEVLFKWVSTRFGLRSFESTSKMRSKMFVRTSKNFVWGA
jgi:hypothetical protein